MAIPTPQIFHQNLPDCEKIDWSSLSLQVAYVAPLRCTKRPSNARNFEITGTSFELLHKKPQQVVQNLHTDELKDRVIGLVLLKISKNFVPP